jgi:hypothetical protein
MIDSTVALNLMNRNSFTRFRRSNAFKQFLAHLQSWTQGGLKVRADRASQIGSLHHQLARVGERDGGADGDVRSLLHTALSAAANEIDEVYNTPISRAQPQQGVAAKYNTLPSVSPMTPFTPMHAGMTPTAMGIIMDPPSPALPPPPLIILPGTASMRNRNSQGYDMSSPMGGTSGGTMGHSPPRGSGIMVNSSTPMMVGGSPLLAPPNILINTNTNTTNSLMGATMNTPTQRTMSIAGGAMSSLRVATVVGVTGSLTSPHGAAASAAAKRASLSLRPSPSSDDDDDDDRIIPLS